MRSLSFIVVGVLGSAVGVPAAVAGEIGGARPGAAQVAAGGGDAGAAKAAASAAPASARGTKLAWRREGAPRLLWTGFEARGGHAQVLLQLSAEVAIETRTAKDGTLLFVLKGCRFLRRTDRLPLDTRFFDAAVTRVELRQHGPDVEVTVTLRRSSSPTPRQEAGPDGSSFWVLDFPGATATAEAAP